MQWKNLFKTIIALVIVLGLLQLNKILEKKRTEDMAKQMEVLLSGSTENNEDNVKSETSIDLNWNVEYLNLDNDEEIAKYNLLLEIDGPNDKTAILELGEHVGGFREKDEIILGVPENAILQGEGFFVEEGNNFYCVAMGNEILVYQQSFTKDTKSEFKEIARYVYKEAEDMNTYIFKSQPLMYKFTNNTTFYNNTEETFNSVIVSRDNTNMIITDVIDVNQKQQVEWGYSENSDYPSEWKSPSFVLNIAGNRVPVTKAKIIGDDIREQLFVSATYSIGTDENEDMNVNNDNIIFFKEDGEYYFTPQLDYFERLENMDDNDEIAEYIYLPQVSRWLRQREGQLLFAAGMSQEQFKKYFPDYTGELPEYGMSAIISSEDVYIEDVGVSYNQDTGVITEVRYSDKEKLFTTSDVDIVSIAMDVMFPQDATYFRYKDSEGNTHRQEVGEQMRDSNNGGYQMHVYNLEEMGTRFVPVD